MSLRGKLFPDRAQKALSEWKHERPDLDTLVQNIRARILLLGAYIARDNDRIAKKYHVSGPEMRVLFALCRIGEPYELRPTDLFKSLLVPSGTMTRQLVQLEKLGFIDRKADPEDRRAFIIHLTPRGVSVADAALTEGVRESVISSALENLTIPERLTLNSLLQGLLSNLDNIESLKPN